MRLLVALAPALVLMACSQAPRRASDERQITRNIGLVQSGVLSRDGARVALVSRAAYHANPQIWIAPLDGSSNPVPMTDTSTQNYDPEFSADGAWIYFTSSRTPPGIYRMPVSGGSAELIVPDGLAAKISPDGQTLLYGLGGKVHRRALAGGPGQPLLPDLENSYAPVWSPEGDRVLLAAKRRDQRKADWWMVSSDGANPQKTSIVTRLQEQGFNSVVANAWLPGDWIVFSGLQGETQTLWKIQLNPGGEIGKAVRASDDPEGDYNASWRGGKLVFVRTRVEMNLWALPLDETGERTGPPEALTTSPARKAQESLAGGKLLYSAETGDRFSLFLKTSKQEKRLRDGFFAVLTPDGRRYAYGDGTKENQNVFLKSLSWWAFWSTKLCANCTMPRGFSPDSKKLLLWADSPPIHHLDMLDLPSGRPNRVVWSNQDLSGPRLSPDGNWVSFVAGVGEHRWQTFVAPVSPEKLLSSFEWIPVTPVSDSFHFAFWSEKGDIIYILTAREGAGNLKWLEAQKVDSTTKVPIGAPVTIYEFNDLLVPGMDPIWNTPSAAGGRIVIELGQVSSDLWVK